MASTMTLVLKNAPSGNAKVEGDLTMNGKTYRIVTGGHGKGALPAGTYSVKVRNAVEGSQLAPPFKAGGAAFFIPIDSEFETKREGFGIHPDGNVPGTLGCVGIEPLHAKPFLKAWKAMGISSRPTTLEVVY